MCIYKVPKNYSNNKYARHLERNYKTNFVERY